MGALGDLLAHPSDFGPLVKMALAARQAARLPKDPGLAFCYDILNSVSRSFAVVIQQLPNPLRDAICIFYLVLRGLDTVEDDMAIQESTKIPALLSFHEQLYDRGFSMDCGYKHYKRLMKQFGTVVDVFLDLEEEFQEVIVDITRRMGHGMAEFIQKEVKTVADYDLYCHYVAGLVGIGLSRLFASSNLEADEVAEDEDLANQMGLFLQKTNIIRDYLEDILEEPAPRMFWPRAIWGQYAQELQDFKHPENRDNAVECLNEMIVNALHHMPACIQYMSMLRDRMVFRFCAIPQIMAIGTLAACYNNGKVFEGVVKMRRGQVAQVFSRCDNMYDLYTWFLMFLEQLEHKAEHKTSEHDRSRSAAIKIIQDVKAQCDKGLNEWSKQHPATTGGKFLLHYMSLLLSAAYFYYALGLGSKPLSLLDQYAWLFHDYRLYHQVLAVMSFLLIFRTAVLGSW